MRLATWAFVGLFLSVLARPELAGAQCPGLPLDFSGSQYVDCMTPVLRITQIAPGLDLGEQKPPLLPHSAVNLTGASPPNTAWLAVYAPADFGDGMVCVDHLDSEINGEQCGGVCALVTTGLGGRAICARSCDAKGTDTLRLGLLNVEANAWLPPTVTANLFGKIDTYGGTIPPANCDHHDGQADWHMYCQWVRTCLLVTSTPPTVAFTASTWLRGSGGKNDPTRNDPDDATLTLIGTATWTGARPAGLALTGKIGIVGSAAQSVQAVSLTGLVVGP